MYYVGIFRSQDFQYRFYYKWNEKVWESVRGMFKNIFLGSESTEYLLSMCEMLGFIPSTQK